MEHDQPQLSNHEKSEVIPEAKLQAVPIDQFAGLEYSDVRRVPNLERFLEEMEKGEGKYIYG